MITSRRSSKYVILVAGCSRKEAACGDCSSDEAATGYLSDEVIGSSAGFLVLQQVTNPSSSTAQAHSCGLLLQHKPSHKLSSYSMDS
ncbi:hypothetical protein PanWU01x14_302250 [Parasponia andersonii]|uniref:Uncharacterized protein n=1 Tax=Parasponia andersonii TaxID=3476 RepID=A0A2P5ATC5_PARAD|nr:hypothetical protein PanWU01x14_302250 [Parasponia andersonii]